VAKRQADHLRDICIELARVFLLNTDLPVDTIAWRTGLSMGDRLAKVFNPSLQQTKPSSRAA